MQNSINKKIISFFLVTSFLFASFWSFASIANAAIANELISLLNLSITPDKLYMLPEIPEELDATQRAKVLDGIIIHPLVRKTAADYEIASLGVESAQAKVDAAQEIYDRLFRICSARQTTPPGGDCATDSQFIWAKDKLDAARAELTMATNGDPIKTSNIGLNKAEINLVEAFIAARRDQNPVITAMIPEGQAVKMFDTAVKQLTESQKAFSDSTANVGTVDAGQAGTQQTVNPDNVNDSMAFGQEVLKFLADEQADKLNGLGLGGAGTGGGIAGGAGGGGEIAAGSFVIDSSYTIKTLGTTDFTKIGASTNTVGSVFKATGPGSGTGTAVLSGSVGVGAITPPRKPTDDLVASIHKACTNIITAFMPCIADGFYYVLYKPASYALEGAGMIFDYILMLSIDNSKDMVAPKFVDEAWTVVRDFSNMLFIFVLLYTGIMTMFGGYDWKKVVIRVVVVALLINFSLFFTKVVIDAGNVLAIGVKSGIGNESLSAGLVDAFKPQRFLVVAASADKGSDQALNAIIVFIIAAVVSGFAAYYFFKAALLFFGRLLGFWFLMIVSPFVFVSTALPAGDQMKKWFSSLLGLTFAAPVFLFLVYLLTMIISAGDGIMSSFSKTGIGWFNSLLGPVMAATLVILALKEILALTEKMAGDFGKLGADMASVAMTGAAFTTSTVGTGTVRALSAIGGKFGGRGGVLGAIGDASAKVGHAGRNATFDVRNIPIPLVGGTVGSHTGAGAGRTNTLNTTKAEAVKRAEEKAKRGEEKPESVGQAIAKAETKRAEAAAKKAARIPEIEKRIAAMKREAATLSAANGGLVGDALTLQLKANLRAAEASARVMEDSAVRNPNDGQAQVDSLRAKRDKESAEKNLKKATSYSDDIEKLEKQLEEYKK